MFFSFQNFFIKFLLIVDKNSDFFCVKKVIGEKFVKKNNMGLYHEVF